MDTKPDTEVAQTQTSTLSSADRAIRVGGSAAGASLFGGAVGASFAGPVGAIVGAIVGGVLSSGLSYVEALQTKQN